MLATFKRIWNSLFSPQPRTPAKRESDGTQWCLVGNIAEQRKNGEEGAETRGGTKHFSPGAKVFCLPAQWGDGYEQILVIGRHRGSKRFVTMIISSDWVINWRAGVVYNPTVLKRLVAIEKERGRSNWTTKEEVQKYVAALKGWQSTREDR